MAGRLPVRRRLSRGWFLALNATLGLALLAAGCSGRIRTGSTVAISTTGPSVNIQAFRHHGNLAFVSGSTLWVLDGATGGLREVTGSHPTEPRFSPDGKWLAYLRTGPPDYGLAASAGQLWIAHANGSDPRAVRGLGQASDPAWSPTADVLGVIAGRDGGVALVSPSGSWHGLAGTSSAAHFVWSPDGRDVAFAGYYAHGALETASVAGGSPVLWQAEHNDPAYPESFNPTIPARWLPRGEGILYWVDQDDSASIAEDGLPLFLVTAPRGAPHLLGVTLVDSASIATSPTGKLAITQGTLRYQWTNKAVERCSTATASCSKVPVPPGTVSIDPAWSPDGSLLLYAEGPDNGQSDFAQAQLTRWYSKLRLWSIGASAPRPEALPGTQGAAVSEWSAGGQDLLYESGDGLWLSSRPSGRSTEIVRPLFPPDGWPQYYAQVDWTDQFDWFTGPQSSIPSR